MSAGDLIGRDRQAELDGVLLGEGTRFQLSSWDMFPIPDVQTKDTDRNDLGIMPGVDTYTGRLITLEVWLDAFPDLDECIADRSALESAFAPSNETRQLHFRVQDERFCYIGRGRGVRTELPTMDAWPVECRFMATDPRYFSGVEHVAELPPTTPTVLTNAGTRSTPWVWTVVGPWDDPELVLTSDPTTYTFRFPGMNLGEGEVLRVDSATGMALRTDTSVIGQARDSTGLRLPFPWSFAPGDVSWTCNGGDTDGTATLAWRDAWA